MNQIKIDSNIQIPTGGKQGFARYPWAKMKIGDSFAAPIGARNSISVAGLKNKMKFVSRSISKTEVRIWRVE